MDNFIDYIAERKINLYLNLYKRKPQAYTENESFERIKRINKYEEILEVIAAMPLDMQRKVNEIYDERISVYN